MIEVVDLVKEYRASDGSGGAGRRRRVVQRAGRARWWVCSAATVPARRRRMRILATLLAPTSGTARVAACDVCADPIGVRRASGLRVGDHGRARPAHAPRDARFVRPAARPRGRDRLRAADRAPGRQPRPRRPSSTVRAAGCRRDSGSGCRSRGRSIHDPPVLVLDEPTSALDVLGSRDLLELLARSAGRGPHDPPLDPPPPRDRAPLRPVPDHRRRSHRAPRAPRDRCCRRPPRRARGGVLRRRSRRRRRHDRGEDDVPCGDQRWRARLAIARRDLLEFVRDRRALFITLLMPMAMYPMLALSSTLGRPHRAARKSTGGSRRRGSDSPSPEQTPRSPSAWPS